MKTYKIEYGDKREPLVKYCDSIEEAKKEFTKICKFLYKGFENPDTFKRAVREGAYIKLYSKEVGLWSLEKSASPAEFLESLKENK